MARLLVALLLSSILTMPLSAQQLLSDRTSETSGMRVSAWYLPDDDMLGFVKIPAGTFAMGSDPVVDPMAFENERWSAERRQGRVELADYYIGRFEVTVAQFKAFADATGYQTDASALNSPLNHPVAFVSWTDALAYSRWLERMLKDSNETPTELRQLLQQGWRITLPSEAEWEKAARGFGSRIFPWGNQPRTDRANFGSTATLPVGSYECSECAYGLADMSGNVWELTRSPYQPYPFDPADDRGNLNADALWVMRGGSFSDPANLVRTGVRGGVDPGARRASIGFRVVLSRL
jgi:formylglycine-generating enzyme required for sulfatase activity